jgi:hypothetical protein
MNDVRVDVRPRLDIVALAKLVARELRVTVTRSALRLSPTLRLGVSAVAQVSQPALI